MLVAHDLSHPLDLELGERLKHVYKLNRSPQTLHDVQILFAERRQKNPHLYGYLELVKQGDAIIGACKSQTNYANYFSEGEIRVMCGYDALMNVLLRGSGIARGHCMHCGESLELEIADQKRMRLSHPNLLFWLGTGEIGAPGNPVCDHLHLFPHQEHLEAWLETRPDVLGVAMPVTLAIDFLKEHPIPPRKARTSFDA